MDYAEIRKLTSRIVPGMRPLFETERKIQAVREKGRKKNYSQYNLLLGEWRKQERLLDTEEIDSFLEISIRAQACPMPFNADVWDGLLCPFGCIYCYANAFRASLYTAFFDNSKTMGMRHCDPEYYKREMDKMQNLRRQDPHPLSGIKKAFAMEIPLRFGIRFEDFLRQERRAGVSLSLLEYLKETAYPVMINTKSDLVGTDAYVRALSENPAGAAVHITLLTSDDQINKDLEPAAPSYKERMEAAKTLAAAGVRVVMRIEPYLFLVNDTKEDIQKYAEDMTHAGIKNITFDTYSYTALNPGIRQSFINHGYDFDRLFLAGCDSQLLGSILLEKYMDEFRKHGISCSTFDMGNVPNNDQEICCEVSDIFHGCGWNWGSAVMAIRYITKRSGKATRWSDFRDWVYEKGGFLTEALEREVHELWNMEGNMAYSVRWAQGMIPVGWDEDGIVWSYFHSVDERTELINVLKERMECECV